MSVDDRPVSGTATAGDGSEPGRSSGVLVVAWQDPRSRGIAPVGLLEHGPDVGYRFRYLRCAAELEYFQPFLSFPEFDGDYRSPSLFPLFSQRIMSSRRPDFDRFLDQLHLDREASPWEQLARSEGRRTADTLQVFPVPVVEPDGTSVCRFLVHGIRHVTDGDLPPLRPGDALTLRDAPDNPVNPRAVLVCAATDRPLGYVPDLLLEHLAVLRDTGPVSVTVEHVNGPEAPMHLRLLVRLDGTAPPGYRPMSGPAWQPHGDG